MTREPVSGKVVLSFSRDLEPRSEEFTTMIGILGHSIHHVICCSRRTVVGLACYRDRPIVRGNLSTLCVRSLLDIVAMLWYQSRTHR